QNDDEEEADAGGGGGGGGGVDPDIVRGDAGAGGGEVDEAGASSAGSAQGRQRGRHPASSCLTVSSSATGSGRRAAGRGVYTVLASSNS
uniref:Uncharacterized protein n=1 Tax=Oryza glaberrima TaxID=4538 RepID=I1NJP4_ORYGL